MSKPENSSTDLSVNRRALLAGVGAGSAAMLLAPNAQAQGASGKPIVFTHVTVVNVDAVQDDVALAVVGDTIAAIGPTETVLARYPGAALYDGRGKALVPGLVNCHAHLTATIARGFNEDFGFPNSAPVKLKPEALLSADERSLMATIGALEAIKTGTTTLCEFAGGIAPYAADLAQSGLRCVLVESASDCETVAGAISAEGLAKSVAPTFSARKRDEGMQHITDLHSAWHGKAQGRVSVFPAAALAETSSPELLKAVRAFAEKHDLGYSIHLSQSIAEVDFMKRYHGVSPPAFLAKYDYLGPRLFAAHCRYVSDADIGLLGTSRTIISHQAAMAANRGVIPPIPALRAAGAPIANGTDNNTNDLFEVMRVALLTERIKRDDAMPGMRPQPEDMLYDATMGGALATGHDKIAGTLTVGQKADILVLDTLKPHLVPCGRILSAWIHNGQASDIESSMVDGAFIMKDRKVLTLDETALVTEADKVGKRIWAQVRAAGAVKVPGRSVNI